MRDFEQDFEFDFNVGIYAASLQDCRIDKYRAMIRDPDRSSDPEHQARIAAHIERIRREMQELGITKGSRE